MTAPTSETFSFIYAVGDGYRVEAEWTGDRTTAIARAVRALEAEQEGDGLYMFRVAEIGRNEVHVDADAMARLGAALLYGASLEEAFGEWWVANRLTV